MADEGQGHISHVPIVSVVHQHPCQLGQLYYAVQVRLQLGRGIVSLLTYHRWERQVGDGIFPLPYHHMRGEGCVVIYTTSILSGPDCVHLFTNRGSSAVLPC